jgi:hypothetical protein
MRGRMLLAMVSLAISACGRLDDGGELERLEPCTVEVVQRYVNAEGVVVKARQLSTTQVTRVNGQLECPMKE